MKKLMMFAAILGLATTMTYAQETTSKTVKTDKKHKTEVVKKETKTTPEKTETVKKTTVETKSKTK